MGSGRPRLLVNLSFHFDWISSGVGLPTPLSSPACAFASLEFPSNSCLTPPPPVRYKYGLAPAKLRARSEPIGFPCGWDSDAFF
jgi:hypothetical protein